MNLKEPFKRLKSRISLELIRYIILAGSTTLAIWAAFWFFVDVMGYSALYVAVATTPINFVWRYLMQKKWVFKHTKTDTSEGKKADTVVKG